MRQTRLCSVCRLTLARYAALRRGGGNKRAGVCVIDADVSVCRLRAEGGNRLGSVRHGTTSVDGASDASVDRARKLLLWTVFDGRLARLVSGRQRVRRVVLLTVEV
jgi:hypothetical protein